MNDLIGLIDLIHLNNVEQPIWPIFANENNKHLSFRSHFNLKKKKAGNLLHHAIQQTADQ